MKTPQWLVVFGLMAGCIAPPMDNPNRQPKNPVEKIIEPVEDILKLLLGVQNEQIPQNPNPAQNRPQRDQKKADHAKGEAAKALQEAKQALDEAASRADKARLPQDRLADAAQPLNQAAAQLDEVAKRTAAATQKAQAPAEKKAAHAAQNEAAQAAQQARNLARMAQGKLPKNLPGQIAAAAQELAEQDVPALEKMTTGTQANSAKALEAARQALQTAQQAAAAAKGDPQKLKAAAQPLEQAADQFNKVARQAAQAAQAAQAPGAKQNAAAAQQAAAQAAQKARALAALAQGRLPANLPGHIARATKELADQKIPNLKKNAAAAKADVAGPLNAAKLALGEAAAVAAATAKFKPDGALLDEAAQPLEQAAGKLDEAARQAAQTGRQATSRKGRQAAEAASRQARSAARQVRNMARHAKGELAADSAKEIADNARIMAGRGIDFTRELAKRAGVDAGPHLDAAKAAFEQAAQKADTAAAQNAPHPTQSAAPLTRAAEELDEVAKLAGAALAGGKTDEARKAAMALQQTAAKAAQHARNMAARAKGELPADMAGQIAKAAADMASEDLPGLEQVLNGEVPATARPGAAGVKLAFLTNPFALRKDPNARRDIIEELGGSQDTEDAVKRALDWFTRVQLRDGSWEAVGGHEAATTGLAMLAYMGYGAKHTWSLEEQQQLALITKKQNEQPANPGRVGTLQPANPKGKINKPVKNAELTHYQKPLAKAVEWLLRIEKNGDLRGPRGDMYDHGIAAIALAEAYSLTKDPRLRQPLERVVAFTVRAQNPKTGGWRYRTYQENPRERGDLSVTGWQLMALKSAQRGGLDVPDQALDRVKTFLNLVGNGPNGGDYRYLTSGGTRNPSMVAEGMFCRQLLGPDRKKLARANGLLQQAAAKFTEIAQLTAQNAKTPEEKTAAQLAKTEAENAAQIARDLAANTKKIPREKLPAKIADLAEELTEQVLPKIKTQIQAAQANADATLTEAKAILDRIAQAAEAARIDATHPRMRESTRIIQGRLPTRSQVNYYYWYYGSLSMHQNQGDPWKKWNQRLQPILLRGQVRNGRHDGSWDPAGIIGTSAGRPVITALATLSLEVYYRYLPLNSLHWMNEK